MTNKEKILNYCKHYMSGSIDSLQTRDDIVSGLTQENFKHYLLSGCPHTWGLDEFDGDCYKDNHKGELSYLEQTKQCENCWARALSE